MEGVSETDLHLILGAAKNPKILSDVLEWIQSNNPDIVPPTVSSTTVQSFAISFLNFIRASVRPFLRAAEAEQQHLSLASTSQEITTRESTSHPQAINEQPKKSHRIKPRPANIVSAGQNTYPAEFPVLGKEAQKTSSPQAKYEEEFPALALAAPKGDKGIQNKNAKEARRVNPTPTTNPEVHSSFVLAKVVPLKDSRFPKASKASGVSPLKDSMDLLMYRVNKPRRHSRNHRVATNVTQQKIAEVANKATCLGNKRVIGDFEEKGSKHINSSSESTVMHYKSSEHAAEQYNHSSILPVELKNHGTVHACKSSEHTAQHYDHSSISPVDELRRLGTVHAKLIMSKMVPSLVGELYFLLQLLHADDVLKTQGKNATAQQNLSGPGIFFVDDGSCSMYACKTLEYAEKLLDCVGEQLLAALIEQPAISYHSPSLLSHLRGALVEHQSATLRSFKSYEAAYPTKCTLEEFPRTSMTSKPSKQIAMGMPPSMPFHAARDSRNNFNTNASQRIYNNRESCRDQFYALIREAASLHATFGFRALSQENESYTKLQVSVQKFLKCLMLENYPWFLELFVEQYLQASSFGETDPEVTGLARNAALKLQKLHVRLTSECSNQSQVCMQKRECQGPFNTYHVPSSAKNLTKGCFFEPPANVNTEHSAHCQEAMNGQSFSPDEFLKAFPYCTRVYILVLAVADSYRLNSQLMCTIKSKIYKLTKLPLYSQEAENIGSSFTQRVLYLKSLAILMGFLVFYPRLGSMPSILGDKTNESLCSDALSFHCHLPIDLLKELENARKQESLLLVLPWILDFLRIMKASQRTEPELYFEKLFISLKALYSLPALDPSNEHFGVNSMCINAALDSFFDEMGMLEFDVNTLKKPALEGSLSSNGKQLDICTEITQKGLGCNGIDKMLGIVDTSYIELCCPLLTGMKSLLNVTKKEQKLQQMQVYRNTPVRKITPILSTKQGHPIHMHKSVVEPSIASDIATVEKDELKLKLQHAFLEQRPHLQRLVDFIVDTAAVNAAQAATLKYVPGILEDAKNKLEMAILDRFPTVSDIISAEDFEAKLNASNFEAAMEHIINTTIEGVLPKAIEYAEKHFSDRTMEALSSLAAPTESSYVLSVAAGIVSEAAALAVSKKTLANVSSEIRKQVTVTFECWRRKLLRQITKEPKILELDRLEPVPDEPVFSIDKSNEISKDGPQAIDSETTASSIAIGVTGKKWRYQKLFQCCKEVYTLCSNCELSDEARNAIRLQLASVSLVTETILSGLEHELPSGGFDAIVSKPEKEQLSDSFSTDQYLHLFRIEAGLLRRSVALASYWCLVSPATAFGFTDDEITDECYYHGSQTFHVNEYIRILSARLDQHSSTAMKREGEYYKTHIGVQPNDSDRHQPQCLCPLRKSKFGSLADGGSCPIGNLTSLWSNLIRTGMGKLELILAELFCPWRWEVALSKKPWSTSSIWCGALAHGISNMLIFLTGIASEKGNAVRILLQLIEGLGNAFCNDGDPTRKESLVEAKKVLQCILIELMNNL